MTRIHLKKSWPLLHFWLSFQILLWNSPSFWNKVNLALVKWFISLNILLLLFFFPVGHISIHRTSLTHFWKRVVFSALLMPSAFAAHLESPVLTKLRKKLWPWRRGLRAPPGGYCSALSSLIFPAFLWHLHVPCCNPKKAQLPSKGAKLLIPQTDSSILIRLRGLNITSGGAPSWFWSPSR